MCDHRAQPARGVFHVSSVSGSAAGLPGFRNPTLSLRKRLDDLLHRLTLDERPAMPHQYAPAAVLLGEAEPAGRLPQTWYRDDGPLPAPLGYDAIEAGWTCQYHRTAPLHPLGHGLSCTDFARRDLLLSHPSVDQDGTADVKVTVADSGPRPGTEVVSRSTSAPWRPATRRPGCAWPASASSGGSRGRAASRPSDCRPGSRPTGTSPPEPPPSIPDATR